MNKLEQFNFICLNDNVQLAFLFGSMAESGHNFLLEKDEGLTFDPYSNLDLGVVFLNSAIFQNIRQKSLRYGRLFEELSALFSPFRLDLVFLEETDFLVQFEATKGINIFKQDDVTLADYQEQVLKYAGDWKFEVDRFHQEVRAAIKEGLIVVEYETVVR